jgi:hypothetical protein
MSSFVAFRPRWICLAECGRSSFALVVYYLCAGEDLPPSDDVDNGYQWEVQIDEGWVPCWDSYA